MRPVQSTVWLLEGPYSWGPSSAIILKCVINFEHGTLYFHYANYVASPIQQEGLSDEELY